MTSPPGIVHLVGAGPGDPGLITVRGLSALREAQVVIFDRLVDCVLLAEAPPDAERIDVGKRPGDAPVSQDEIDALILNRAKKGMRVVRLKGGDPFIFGRGFEELSACRGEEIDCVVIPGVSSAIAASEAAGIPLTLRGISRSFAVLTAETAPDTANAIDFSRVRGVDTLVVMMGRSKLESIARTLMESGWSPDTPVACIEQATTPRQRNVVGTLATIAAVAQEAELAAPMVTVIGEVARHASPSPFQVENPPWRGEGRGEGKSTNSKFDPGAPGRNTNNRAAGPSATLPVLAGKKVLITRPRAAAKKLAAKLERLGAVPIVCPLLRIEIPSENTALDAAVRGLPEYNWLAFTSAHGVKALWRRLAACGFDARRLSGCKLAALGFATKRELCRCGLNADVAARSAGELAVAIIAQSGGSPGPVLWPRGDRALSTLPDRLRQAGSTVDDPVAYHTLFVKPAPAVLDHICGGVDAVLLYSPSAATHLASLALSPAHAIIIVCIGDSTAAAATAAGLHVDAIAAQPSDDGVLAELERCFSSKVAV